MRRTVTFLALLLSAHTSWSQPHPQLEPDESLLFSPESPEYIARVREGLLKDLPIFRAFLVFSNPSFESAWVAWVEVEPESKACSRTFASPPPSGAQSTAPDVPAKPESRCVPLDAKLANAIAEAWLSMLWNVRYQPTDEIGLDGTTFHFSGFCRGVGILAGQTWSPHDATPTGRLVALAEALKAYALAPSREATQSLRKRAAAVPADRRLTSRCS